MGAALLADYGTSSGGGGGGAVVFLLFAVAIWLLTALPLWFIFTKAGGPGWPALIPIYNILVLLKVVGRPWWWLLLFIVPIVNIVIWIIVYNDLSKSFGHGGWFTVGLVFLTWIFMMIIAFSGDRYLGPAALGPVTPGQPPVPPPATA